MTVAKLFPGELIGKKVTILTATDPKLVGWKGKVIDETKNSLKVSSNGTVKTLLKTGITFKLDETGQILSGAEIAKRPEDRLKGK